jgi:hypothetical protein
MKAFVEQGAIAGAVMLAARHGVVASLDVVGYQDLETKKPMRRDTIFRVASIAKPVTAIGIMILQEEGHLVLNGPVGNYLPEFRGLRMKDGSAPGSPVTLQGLMTHTSGLASEGELFKSEFMAKSLAEVVAAYAQAPLDSQPRTKWLYSSPAFDTLGRIVEVVSGQPYPSCAKTRPRADRRRTGLSTPSEKAFASGISAHCDGAGLPELARVARRLPTQASSSYGPAAATARLLPPAVIRLGQSTPAGGHRLPARREPSPPRGERFPTTAPD